MILILVLCLVVWWMLHNFGQLVHPCTMCGETCDCNQYEGICNHCLDEPEENITVDGMGNHWINNGKYWELKNVGT